MASSVVLFNVVMGKMLRSHDHTTSSSPFLLVVIHVQVVGHLGVKDGTVLGHVEHGDLVADVLIFGFRRKDPLSDGSHLVVGLCQDRKGALCSASGKKIKNKRRDLCSFSHAVLEERRQPPTAASTSARSP